jgi:hypothetical protein
MSLDVYLTVETPLNKPKSSGIFVRRGGKNVEITEAEWYEMYPSSDPVRVIDDDDETTEVYTANITHNLSKMATVAGLYEALWEPNLINVSKAHQLIVPLSAGLVELMSNPEKYKVYNPKNGWGDYDGLIEFMKDYLTACIKYPEATVSTWV